MQWACGGWCGAKKSGRFVKYKHSGSCHSCHRRLYSVGGRFDRRPDYLLQARVSNCRSHLHVCLFRSRHSHHRSNYERYLFCFDGRLELWHCSSTKRIFFKLILFNVLIQHCHWIWIMTRSWLTCVWLKM